jgi:HEAT repeat protein
MAKVTAPKDLEMRLVQLRDPDWNTRYIAARALIEMGEDAAESLTVLLDDDNHYVRGQAAKCLGAIGSETAVDALVRRLEDPNGAVREEAVKALGQIGSAAVQPLLERMKDPSPTVRRSAIRSLLAIRDPGARSALEAVAKDLNEVAAVRWEAKLAVNRLRERKRI